MESLEPSDIRKADGKMPWRIDWVARWIIHQVTCEPAGKDHVRLEVVLILEYRFVKFLVGLLLRR